MKRNIAITLFAISLCSSNLFAAVPLTWTVETTIVQPATFEAYQGETIDFEAALTSRGKPLEAPSNYSFFWQTNGMGSTYWEAAVQSRPSATGAGTNVLFATWLPSMDVGAKVYNCFIGSPSNNYHAAFQLRLRPSPGATPNALPLPVPVIDFAKVRVLNPPWSGGGGGGGVETNAVVDIIHKTVDGSAKTLPKYLWLYEADDSYPAEAEEYYRSRGNGKTDGGCSSVRDGGFLSRNFDYPFDSRAEFVVKMSAGPGRFASVGIAQVGTNLTEDIVTSGKPEYSRFYKWLPGATVDGINENGVACNINVVDGNPQTSGWHTNATSEAIHPLAAIRWILDHATNTQHGAEYIAANIRFPQGWTQNFHYMVTDERETWIVKNGEAINYGLKAILTNFVLNNGSDSVDEDGWERFRLLALGANITNAWYTNAYRRETNPSWVSDLHDVLAYTNEIFNAWASHPKEYFRGKTNGGQTWWQTVHTSVYDISNRVLRVSVQETDDWYTFQVPASGSGKTVDSYTRAETDARLAVKLGTSGTWRVADDWEIEGVVDHDSDGERLFLGVAVSARHAASANFAENSGVAQTSSYSDDSLHAGTADNASSASSADWSFRAEISRKLNDEDMEFAVDSEGSGLWRVTDGVHPDGFLLKPASDDISADNSHFTNEVTKVVRTLTPPPSPTLRLYDEVRGCWWIGRMVNGVVEWEVE